MDLCLGTTVSVCYLTYKDLCVWHVCVYACLCVCVMSVCLCGWASRFSLASFCPRKSCRVCHLSWPAPAPGQSSPWERGHVLLGVLRPRLHTPTPGDLHAPRGLSWVCTRLSLS